MKIAKALGILVIFCFFITFFGCGGNRIAQKTLNIGFIGKVDNFCPLMTKNKSSWQVLNCLYRGLYRWNDKWEKEPILLKEMPTIENGDLKTAGKSSVIIKYSLKDNLHWSNNSKLNAKDIQYSYQLSFCPLFAQYNKDFYKGIKSVTLINNKKIEFILPITRQNFNIIPLPQNVLDKKIEKSQNEPIEDVFKKDMTYFGPFEAKNLNPRKSILKKNYNYIKPAKLQKIQLQFFHRESDLISNLKKGKIDVAYGISVREANLLLGLDKLKVQIMPSQNQRVLIFNFQNKLIQNKDFRKALFMAIDRKNLSKLLYDKRNFACKSWLSSRHQYFEPVLDIYNDKNIKESIETLEKIDFEIDISSKIALYKKKPLKLQLMIMDEDKEAFEIAKYLKDSIEKIGIKVNIGSYPKSSYDKYLENRMNYDMVIYTLRTGPDVNLESIFKYRKYLYQKKDKSLNLGGWQSRLDDEFAIKYRNSISFYEKKYIFKKQQEYFAQELPFLPLVNIPEVVAYNSKIKGISLRGYGPFTWNCEDWKWN